jgi:hypothetical protein
LKTHELIRREDPGRDAGNPFQQAIAITEVRIPRALMVTLAQAPSRRGRLDTQAAENPHSGQGDIIPARGAIAVAAVPQGARHARATLTREESTALMRKLSDTERTAFFVASRDRRTSMAFDETNPLTPEERGRVLEILTQISTERPTAPAPAKPASSMSRTPEFAQPRRLSPLEAARLRKRLGELVPLGATAEVFRQVLWSMEEGALRRFDPRLAGNIALKKIREGAWTRPNRMPPNWLRSAAPETCSAA